jgi:hypothetical protein
MPKVFFSSEAGSSQEIPATKLGATLLSGVCVSINIMMGSGFLALPAVFQKAGPLFSFSSLVLVGVVMYITCCWEGRAVCRASFRMGSSSVREVTEALRLFIGDGAALSYVFVLGTSFIGVVWAYAILFAESLSSSLPLLYTDVACVGGSSALAEPACYLRYMFNLVLFGVATTPLSLMDVSDQAQFQLCITALTALLVAIMVGTATHAFALDQMAYSFPNAYLSAEAAPEVAPSSVLKDCLSCLSACVFSVYLNGSVVMVSDALGDKGGGRLENMFAMAIGACCSTYALLYSLAFCFGTHIDPLANLNWRGFRFPSDAATAAAVVALGPDGTAAVPGSMLAKAVELYVVLFPALVVLSVYPLSTKIVANLLLEVIYGASPEVGGGAGGLRSSALDDLEALDERAALLGGPTGGQIPSYQGGAAVLLKVHPPPVAAADHSAAKTAVRVAVNLAPIAGAVLVPDVDAIVVFVGGVSVVVGLVYPSLLSAASSAAMALPGALQSPGSNIGAVLSAPRKQLFLPPAGDWKEHPVLRMGCLAAGCVLAVLIIGSPWM